MPSSLEDLSVSCSGTLVASESEYASAFSSSLFMLWMTISTQSESSDVWCFRNSSDVRRSFLMYAPLPQDPDACFWGPRDSSWRSLMPSDSQIFVLWEVYIYRYTMNCKCLLTWILCTLSKRTIFYIYSCFGWFLYEDDTLLCKHFPCKLWNILRCVFTVPFSRPLLPKNERKKISATNSALLVYSFSRHGCQCGCNKVCL